MASRLPPDVAWSKLRWRKHILLLLQSKAGAFLQEEAEAVVGHLEELCRYLIEWDDSQGPISPPCSFEDLHEMAFADSPVLLRIVQLLWQLKERRVYVGGGGGRAGGLNVQLKKGKHHSVYKAKFAAAGGASSDESSDEELDEMPAMDGGSDESEGERGWRAVPRADYSL